MRLLKLIDQRLEEALLVVFSSVMVSVIFLQVVMRLAGNSLSWSEELGRYCFIWLVYIGISYGVKKQRHLKVDVMLLVLKDKGKLILSILSNLLFLVFAIIVMKYGSAIAMKLLSFGQQSPALHIPMGLVYLSAPIGMGLAAIRLLQNIYKQFKMLIGKEEMNVSGDRERLQEEKGGVEA
ncbi:C4-dicarboxylate ABC transporter [Pontibacillus chungwhensis BH030062]|uniref:C4-dicarboxylate ABC transporter n=2 Tax=Pontibacillus TaxID=289201 RepID=A0A0A2UMX6_9BACI|nr:MULTISPECIES: TRAP transporter small permease [Pontibacillus]KGP89647.1 C4-dicarboxylate ABC transporter [Pontibacillus chungwhensis BH030062]QST00665.1 TRAP transporter small permease [Pontibacillus sp. ALD_SL1]GGD15649.1 tripartite ATP-independent periplasmic transporter DctQ [Pontibacillus salipaludis]